MAPPNILREYFQRRDSGVSTIITGNPLKDHTFVATVAGLVVGAVLFLVVIGLFLCFYRENSPFSRCCGSRKRPRFPEPKTFEEAPSLNSFSSSPTPPKAVLAGDEDLSHHLHNNSWVDRVRYSVALPRR